MPAPLKPIDTHRKVLEKDVESDIREDALKRGMYCRKFQSQNQRSVPDRLFVAHGRTFFLELKRPGEKPTPNQHKEMRAIRDAGGWAGWVDNAASGIAILDLFDAAH